MYYTVATQSKSNQHTTALFLRIVMKQFRWWVPQNKSHIHNNVL